MKSVITGSGMAVGAHAVPNAVLEKIMDTTDEWIRTRSGVQQRYYVEDGVGSAELGIEAAEKALASAGRTRDDIDAVIFATMTPNFYFPGNGPVLQAKMGFRESLPTFDIRQQCSGFLYGLDLADSLIRSGKYRRLLLVGAEVHTPFMPWKRGGWAVTIGEDIEITDDMRALNTKLRDRTVLFGDGAGAVVIEASENGDRGFIAARLYTNGSNIEALYVSGVGFRRRPYVDVDQIEERGGAPQQEGAA